MLPQAFEAEMKRQLGDDYAAFEKALESPPPVSIRLNPRKYNEVRGRHVPWSTSGFYLDSRPSFTLDPLFHGGAYYVQEASSMVIEQAFLQHVNPEDPLIILDLCAAPGGKSTHILSLINDDSLLISNEVIRSRVSVLTENIQKWGSPNVIVTNNDASDFSALPALFDVVVVDAPCSGEGMFRKDPKARTEWSASNVELCGARQKRILEDVWPTVKSGGLLIYSTCTFNRNENEENLQWFRLQHDVEFLQLKLPSDWNITETKEGPVTGYRLYPHHLDGEGFFLCLIRKKERVSEIDIFSQGKKTFAVPSERNVSEIKNWITASDGLIQRNETIQLLPAGYERFIFELSRILRIAYAGTYVAVQKHNKLIPEHSLALSSKLNKNAFPQIHVSLDVALRYLRRETVVVPEASKGFNLVLYDDVPLGWLNVVPGRANNLYPSAWRIRMA